MNRSMLLTCSALSLLTLAWPTVLTGIFPDYTETYIPGLMEHLPILAAMWIIPFMREGMCQAVSLVWVFWYFIGTLNTMASALFLGSHYSHLPLERASVVYGCACLAYFSGIKMVERFASFGNKSHEVTRGHSFLETNPIIYRILVYFPFVWVVSLYVNVGYIPALSGVDITAEIYETRYGPLYPYTAVLAISALAFLSENLRGKRIWLAALYVLAVVLISFADGKRVVAMIFAGGLFTILFARYRKGAWQGVIFAGVTFVVLYIIVQIVRQGGSTERYASDGITGFMAVGVEYRDFVFSMNFLSPGMVPGYAWGTSAAASMLNEALLASFGISKSDIVSQGSAYIWSRLFESPYGIRTGIVSELWFAYEYLYIFVLAALGGATATVVRAAFLCKDPLNRTLLQGVIGLSLLLVMGQSTMVAGTLTVYLYLAIAGGIERWIKKPGLGSPTKQQDLEDGLGE